MFLLLTKFLNPQSNNEQRWKICCVESWMQINQQPLFCPKVHQKKWLVKFGGTFRNSRSLDKNTGSQTVFSLEQDDVLRTSRGRFERDSFRTSRKRIRKHIIKFATVAGGTNHGLANGGCIQMILSTLWHHWPERPESLLRLC